MNLWQMIRKRYDGPGWLVVEEVSNGTGYQRVTRRADVVAFGLWPSRGFEVHGLEVKHARSDVQRELLDVEKADAVGKYVDYWWLVVSDLSIIDGLVIPETWGILVPKRNVLRVHRKAPKRKPKALDRAFVAALVRKGLEGTVSKNELEEFKKGAKENLIQELKRDREYIADDQAAEIKRLKDRIEMFEKASGVSLEHHWQVGEIGEAVKAVLEVRELAGKSRHSHWRLDVEAVVAQEISALASRAERCAAASEEFKLMQQKLKAFAAGRLPAIPMLPDDDVASPTEAAAWAQAVSADPSRVDAEPR